MAEQVEGTGSSAIPLSNSNQVEKTVNTIDLCPVKVWGCPALAWLEVCANSLERLEAIRVSNASTLAHEFRTPLTTILGGTQMIEKLLEKKGRLDRGKIKPLAQSVVRQAAFLDELIGEYVDVERFSLGKLHLELEPIRLSELLQSAVRDFQLAAQKHNLVLRKSPPAVTLLIDSSRIYRVLKNLLENAAKYSEEGTDITVSAQKGSRRWVIISVSDQGFGIPPDALNKIFDLGYRVPGAKGVSGSGFGLNYAKTIVEAHGGTIWAESEEEKGSTFSFTLPEAPKKRPKGTPSQDWVSGSIL